MSKYVPLELVIRCPTCGANVTEALNWTPLKDNEEAKTLDIEGIRLRCNQCGRMFGVKNLSGYCLTCKHNAGPCLPGGTRNMCSGAICTHVERALEITGYDTLEEMTAEYPDDEEPSKFGGVLVYRYEVILDGECPSYEPELETFREYLGINMFISGVGE